MDGIVFLIEATAGGNCTMYETGSGIVLQQPKATERNTLVFFLEKSSRRSLSNHFRGAYSYTLRPIPRAAKVHDLLFC